MMAIATATEGAVVGVSGEAATAAQAASISSRAQRIGLTQVLAFLHLTKI